MSFLGALGGFGSGFGTGLGQGLDIYDKILANKGNAAFMKSLQGLGSLTPDDQGLQPPDPGQASESGANMPTPQAPMAPMQPGMQPPMGGFAGSIPGAQPMPQQPGGAQPPGVPPMQQMASAAPGGGSVGMSPIDSPHMLAVKGFEGYDPRAKWDYKQYSGGYGTRASRGETFTPQSADSRFQDEMYKAKVAVDGFAPGLPQGPRDALTSLTYNAGTAWQKGPIGQAARAGDFQRMAQLLAQSYTTAGGQQLPGLVQRRREEASWALGRPVSPQALAAGRAAEAKAQGMGGMAAQGQQPPPDRTNPDVLQTAVKRLQSGGLLDLQQMAQLVERANPGENDMVKFHALQAGMKLMNSAGQQQFNQMMQILNLQERMQSGERAERREERSLRGEERRQESANFGQAVRDPEYAPIKASMTQQRKTLDVVHNLEQKTLTIGKKLIELAEKKSGSGIPVFNAWVNAGRRASGDPLVQEFDTQVKAYTSDIGRLLGNPGGILAQGTLQEMHTLLPENLTLDQLKGTQRAINYDVKTGRQITEKAYQKNLNKAREIFKRYGVKQPPPEPDAGEDETVNEDATPATSAPGATTAPAIPEGWTVTPR